MARVAALTLPLGPFSCGTYVASIVPGLSCFTMKISKSACSFRVVPASAGIRLLRQVPPGPKSVSRGKSLVATVLVRQVRLPAPHRLKPRLYEWLFQCFNCVRLPLGYLIKDVVQGDQCLND